MKIMLRHLRKSQRAVVPERSEFGIGNFRFVINRAIHDVDFSVRVNKIAQPSNQRGNIGEILDAAGRQNYIKAFFGKDRLKNIAVNKDQPWVIGKDPRALG